MVQDFTDHAAPTTSNPYSAEARIWGCDYRFRHADGHYLLVSDRSIITRDEHGVALNIVSVIFDKEKRKVEREKYARHLSSQDHLATIANNTASGIVSLRN